MNNIIISVINFMNIDSSPLIKQNNEGFKQIYIKTLQGKNITLDITNNDTILSIKQRIENMEQIPISEQRVVFNGKQLEDTNTIGSYKIEPYSLIYLVFKLRG